MARTSAFAGKVAVVTGGASGIGRAIGARLAALGADVVLADVDGDGLAAAVGEIGSRATAVALDVRDAGAVQEVVDEVAERHARLDYLFNNAGISVGGFTHEQTPAEWDHIIDVNLKGVVNGVLAAYPRMRAQGHGHIVNTASGAGLAPPVFTVAYSATKHAVVGLSVALRPEAALHGVRVSVVCPGAVETPILDSPPTGTSGLTGRQYLAKVGLRPMPADRFAARALRGVAANRAIIVVPGSAKALWYAARLSPSVVQVAGRRTGRRILHDLGPR